MLGGIGLHHRDLDAEGGGENDLHNGADVVGRFQEAEKLRVAGGRHLDYFRKPLGEESGRQGIERIRVDEHSGGLPERPHYVLDAMQVDPRLATHGRIGLGQQGSGYVVPVYAPHIAGRGKAGGIADNSAANRHNGVATGKTVLQQGLENKLHGSESLVGFAFRNSKQKSFGALRQQRVGILGRHPLSGDYQHLTIELEQLARLGESPPGDSNVVGVGALPEMQCHKLRLL